MAMMDFDMDEAITCEACADSLGARRSLVVRLARLGLIETLENQTGETTLVPRRAIMQVRRMQRLRRDLGVNFAGASIILELVERIEQLRREVAERKPEE